LRNKLKWSAASKTEKQTGFAGDLAWTLVSQTLGHAARQAERQFEPVSQEDLIKHWAWNSAFQ